MEPAENNIRYERDYKEPKDFHIVVKFNYGLRICKKSYGVEYNVILQINTFLKGRNIHSEKK